MNDPHSYPQPKHRTPPKDQMIMGINTIQEVLHHLPDRILCLYTSLPKNAKGRKHELLILCERLKIPIVYLPFTALTKLIESDSHQSFVAHIKGRSFYDVKQFLIEKEESETVFVLMLDQIFDPQNFGAIMRSAECFGVDAIAWSKNRGCDLTAVAAKASCGASELLPLLRLSNLSDAVEKFKEAGFEIVAAMADPKAESLFQFQFSSKTVLILGSEGDGIQPLLCKRSHRFISIPLKGKIQSLNVAQAGSVLLSWHYAKTTVDGLF